MTSKEKAFIFEYIHGIPRNQTEAAIKAGYSKRSAARIASRLMKKPAIQTAITEELEELQRHNTTTVNEILDFLTSVMRGEAVDCIEIQTGDREKILVEARPRTCDRLKAAELLGQYYGLFTDKQIMNESNIGIIILPGTDNE